MTMLKRLILTSLGATLLLLSAAPSPAQNRASVEGRTMGVIVEEIDPGSALERAGLRPLDIVLSWERETVHGELVSFFDWFSLETEQAPRGKVRLRVERCGQAVFLSVEPGLWRATVQPVLPEPWAYLADEASAASRQGRLGEAAFSWSDLAEESTESAGDDIVLWTWIKAADASIKTGDLMRGQTLYETAITLAEVRHRPRGLVKAWIGLGDLRLEHNELGGARDAYSAAEKVVQLVLSEENLTRALVQSKIAEVAWRQQDLAQARQFAESSLQRYRTHAPESTQLSKAFMLKAAVQNDMGNSQEASALFHEALALVERLDPGSHQELAILNNLGVLSRSSGDLLEAKRFFNHALSISLKLNERSSMAALLGNLGTVSLDRGDVDEAEVFFRKSLAIYQEIEPRGFNAARLLLNLGRLSIERKNFAAADALCTESLHIRETVSPGGLPIDSPLDCLALSALEQGNKEKARELATRAFGIVDSKARGSLSAGDDLDRLAHIALGQNDLEAAGIFEERAHEIYLRLCPGSFYEASALHGLALIRYRQGRTSEAGALFENSLAALELQLARSHESEAQRGEYRSNRNTIYLNNMTFLLSESRLAEAFRVLERWRAGSFLAQLAERDFVFSDVPQDLDQERRRIAVEYDRTQEEVFEAATERDMVKVKLGRDALATLQAKHDEVIAAIRRATPRLASLRYPQPLGFEDVQKLLDPGCAMLSYSVGPDNIDLFVILPEGPLQTFSIPLKAQELSQMVATFRSLLQEASNVPGLGATRLEAAQRLGRRLYTILIGPAEPLLEKTYRSVIIPDGPLHLLPWGALVRTTRPQYMAEWRPFHIALSATVYAELKKSRERATSGTTPLFVAFGDPALPKPPEAQYSPLPKRSSPLVPLPFARVEVERISGLFPGAAELFVGKEATEERAKTIPQEARYVHFATHAVLDDDFPLNSAVVLSVPETFKEGHDNGLLQAWEIFEGVRLNADLVVLSGCESGLGKEFGGEGLIGLTRAFQYAGARSVLASLWKISDRTTTELMVRFYRHLKEGKHKDEALQAAQIELIHGPIPIQTEKGQVELVDASAPYSWAAFQIYGDWQ